jgi:hypothetical protein
LNILDSYCIASKQKARDNDISRAEPINEWDAKSPYYESEDLLSNKSFRPKGPSALNMAGFMVLRLGLIFGLNSIKSSIC